MRMASLDIEPAVGEHDALTGLVSASAARIRLAQWSRADRREGDWQAMLIGLERLQPVNYAYGQAGGDRALAEIARRVREFGARQLRGEWFAARLGGSDFLLALRGGGVPERWSSLADALADAVTAPISNVGQHLRLAPRLALIRARAGEDPAAVLDSLGEALAKARKQPSLRVVWADGRRSVGGRSAAMIEADLLGALERGEIDVLFQPQFALADGRLAGAEALARWQHPLLGEIGAETLFAVAARAGQTAQLSRQIVARALTSAAAWPPSRELRLSLNLTADDFAPASFAASLRAATAKSGLAPSRLTLEVTEHALLVDLEGAAASLRDLAAEGVRIALDDFGAGFSNFGYLKSLPLDYLKLDHSLTDDIVSSPRDCAILRAIVLMAKALDLEVIAEGVESEAQRALLAAEGCDYYQGFLRARPLREKEFRAFIAAEPAGHPAAAAPADAAIKPLA
jgi:predicted signal transduction protein with EAL and GGDEF domain